MNLSITLLDVLGAAYRLKADMPDDNDQFHRGVVALATALLLPGEEEIPAEMLVKAAIEGMSVL